MRKEMLITTLVFVAAPALASDVSQFNAEMAEQTCTRSYESWEDNIPKRYRTAAECIKDWKINFAKQGEYTGRWSTDLKRCRRFEPYGEGFAEITKRKATLPEASCELKRVKSGAHGKALMYNIQALCDAEGEKIPSKLVFNADSAGMLTIESDGTETTYYRCN